MPGPDPGIHAAGRDEHVKLGKESSQTSTTRRLNLVHTRVKPGYDGGDFSSSFYQKRTACLPYGTHPATVGVPGEELGRGLKSPGGGSTSWPLM